MSNLTNRLLDRLAQVRGITSDYGLAKAIGVPRQTISRYRTSAGQMDDGVAIKAANLLNEDATAILCELHAERAKDSAVKTAWTDLAKLARYAARSSMKAAAAACAVMALCGVLHFSQNAGLACVFWCPLLYIIYKEPAGNFESVRSIGFSDS